MRADFRSHQLFLRTSGTSDVQILSAIDDSWYGQPGSPVDTVFGKFIESRSLDEISPAYVTGDWIAFAQKLNNVSPTSTSSVTFAVGQHRDNVINYLSNGQVGFFKSKYPSVLEAVDGFLNDYESAYPESQAFDKAVFSETNLISSNYTDLTTAAVRQR